MAEPGLAWRTEGHQMVITEGTRPVATYVFRDDKILRPYFTGLHVPGGITVTRTHPPVAGKDATDHDTMHPGLWLAFGDISGQDFWRNKAVVRHERFLQEPAGRGADLTFASLNRLVASDGSSLGTQVSRVTLRPHAAGYFLIWEATFEPDRADLVFGDQEEMGLGVRLATPLTEKNGGMIRNSAGLKTAKATWGKTASWCDYSGTIGNHRVGIAIMPDPANFRPSWFHNRDYGLMVANPFGRNALTQGEKSAVRVKKGESLKLRFGVLLHASPKETELDLDREYRAFVGK